MIKEIEVGGVKHSITLADDMVGSGLRKDMDGSIGLKVFKGHTNHQVMTGLTFSGDELCLNRTTIAENLAGYGLVAENGILRVSSEASDAYSLCGSGLSVDGGRLMLSTGIAGSGLQYNPNQPVIELVVNTYKGLDYDRNNSLSPIYVKIAKRATGLRLFFNSNGELDVTKN